MGIVVKVIAIVMAVVIAIGILGTVAGVGVNLVRYMANQGFDFGMAMRWSWDSYVEWLEKVNPIKTTATEEFPTCLNETVKPCVDLWS